MPALDRSASDRRYKLKSESSLFRKVLTIHFASTMMYFASNMMNFASKMMDFVLKMMNSVTLPQDNVGP